MDRRRRQSQTTFLCLLASSFLLLLSGKASAECDGTLINNSPTISASCKSFDATRGLFVAEISHDTLAEIAKEMDSRGYPASRPVRLSVTRMLGTFPDQPSRDDAITVLLPSSEPTCSFQGADGEARDILPQEECRTIKSALDYFLSVRLDAKVTTFIREQYGIADAAYTANQLLAISYNQFDQKDIDLNFEQMSSVLDGNVFPAYAAATEFQEVLSAFQEARAPTIAYVPFEQYASSKLEVEWKGGLLELARDENNGLIAGIPNTAAADGFNGQVVVAAWTEAIQSSWDALAARHSMDTSKFAVAQNEIVGFWGPEEKFISQPEHFEDIERALIQLDLSNGILHANGISTFKIDTTLTDR